MSLEKTYPLYRGFLRQTCWYEHAHEGNAKELGYLILGLGGETGETLDEFKKAVREAGFDMQAEPFKAFLRQDGHHDKLVAELGDVFWYLTRLCDVLSVPLENLMFMNTYKLFKRINDGDWAPPMDVKWPFNDPAKSYDNVQANYFPEDAPEPEVDDSLGEGD